MKKTLRPFAEPIYVTRPLLPDLQQVMEKLQGIWERKWLTNWGPSYMELEEKLRQTLRAQQLSLFNNGTIALLAACKAMKLHGEVVTTPFTFAATPHVLQWCGVTPVFADIDPETMNLDPDGAAAVITPETSGVVPVHVFGTPCDLEGFAKLTRERSLALVYDAAHAFGVEIDGKGIGSFGDISMFSFHATKTFHTVEGGALAFQDPELVTQINWLKNFGIQSEEEVVASGINGKMNEVQAAIGLLVLDMVEEARNKRAKLMETYRRCLAGVPGVKLPPLPTAGVKSNSQYCVLRLDEAEFGISRDVAHQKLKEYNVITRKYFYPLCSNFACYRHLPSAAPERLPVAKKVAQQVLSMPLYSDLEVQDVERICEMLLACAQQ